MSDRVTSTQTGCRDRSRAPSCPPAHTGAQAFLAAPGQLRSELVGGICQAANSRPEQDLGGDPLATRVAPLPVNISDRTRILVRPTAAQVDNHAVSPDAAALAVESALPIRRFYSWKGKRNYEGRWWSSTTRTHIAFESLLERDALMMADFDTEVVAIAAQPFALLWPRDTSGAKHHVPDFFVRLANGDGRVVDVKRAAAVKHAATQFELTRKACNEICWQYQVFTEPDPIFTANLRWLAGYRHDRFAPDVKVYDRITEAFTTPMSLALGVRDAASILNNPESPLLAHTYHLMWKQDLHTDLYTPLRMDRKVWR